MINFAEPWTRWHHIVLACYSFNPRIGILERNMLSNNVLTVVVGGLDGAGCSMSCCFELVALRSASWKHSWNRYILCLSSTNMTIIAVSLCFAKRYRETLRIVLAVMPGSLRGVCDNISHTRLEISFS